MLLKFIGENEGSGSAGAQCPFVVGEAYEVAEIFEHPWHLMVRNPGDAQWPKPGDPEFGWHPEFFVRTDKPIPIVACGYVYQDYLSDCFGVLLDDPEDVARVRGYDELEDVVVDRHEKPWPQENESYDEWHARVGHEYPGLLAQCVYGLENLAIGVPAVQITDDVFLADAEGIRVPFATVVYGTQQMVNYDVSNSVAQQRITALLRCLSIDARPARLLRNVAWWARDENPRLINPPDCPEQGHRLEGTVGVCPQCGHQF